MCSPIIYCTRQGKLTAGSSIQTVYSSGASLCVYRIKGRKLERRAVGRFNYYTKKKRCHKQNYNTPSLARKQNCIKRLLSFVKPLCLSVCLSVRPSVHPHGTRLSLDGFPPPPKKLIFVYFDVFTVHF